MKIKLVLLQAYYGLKELIITYWKYFQFIPIIIMFLSIFVIGFLLSIKYNSVKVSISVVATGFSSELQTSISMIERPDFSVIGSDALFTGIIERSISPALKFSKGNLKDNSQLRVCSGSFYLDKFSITPDKINDKNTFSIQLYEDRRPLILFANGISDISMEMFGDVDVSDPGCNKNHKKITIKKFFPENVKMRIQGTRLKPAQITFYQKKNSNLAFNDFYVKNIKFLRVSQHGQGNKSIYSTIKKARLHILDSGLDIEVNEHERLNIKGFTGKVNKFFVGDSIKLLLEGVADEVTIGQTGYEKNFNPSVLEVLYANKNLNLIWGAMIFVWSIFYGLKVLLSKM